MVQFVLCSVLECKDSKFKLKDNQDDVDFVTHDLSAQSELIQICFPISLPHKDQLKKIRKMLYRVLNFHQPSSSRKKNHNLPHKLCLLFNEDLL
ncbi:hypothetical protein P8452_58020 [Trifolium repens]|nr:hypothetical protein P8452_58020 [Trifolium repens]